jgi:hypothetical protein
MVWNILGRGNKIAEARRRDILRLKCSIQCFFHYNFEALSYNKDLQWVL